MPWPPSAGSCPQGNAPAAACEWPAVARPPQSTPLWLCLAPPPGSALPPPRPATSPCSESLCPWGSPSCCPPWRGRSRGSRLRRAGGGGRQRRSEREDNAAPRVPPRSAVPPPRHPARPQAPRQASSRLTVLLALAERRLVVLDHALPPFAALSLRHDAAHQQEGGHLVRQLAPLCHGAAPPLLPSPQTPGSDPRHKWGLLV